MFSSTSETSSSPPPSPSSHATEEQVTPTIMPCQTMRGHTREISGVVYLPDGQRIITCSGDGSLRLWNLERGEHIGDGWREEENQVAAVFTLALFPDGKTVASGGRSGTVLLWDVETGEMTATWTGHTSDVDSVCWSPNGERLVSGSLDNTVTVRDVKRGEVTLGPIRTGHGRVYVVAYSPDGTKIATGGYDRNVKVWDSTTGERLLHSNTKARNNAYMWDIHAMLKDAGLEHLLLVPDAPDADARSFLGADATGAELEEAHQLSEEFFSDRQDGDRVHSSVLRGVQPRPPARYRLGAITSFSGRRNALFGRVSSLFHRSQVQPNMNESLEFQRRPEQSTKSPPAPPVVDVAAGRNKKPLFVARPPERPSDIARRVVNPTRWMRFVIGVVYLPDGQRIITCSGDGSLRLWNLERGEQIGDDWREEENQVAAVFTLALSPDGKTVASGGQSGTVLLWDVETGEMTATWTGHTSDVDSVCWSPNGERLVSGSLDNTVTVRDVKRGEVTLGPIRTGHGRVYVVAYSPDGTKIATGGYDGNVKVWDSTTGERLSTLEHKSSVLSRCLAWLSDGKKLVFGEPLIRIFDTAT
ncbi:WD40 repeat-like protein [Rhizopogon salebrosus TDB-379]|nr:WD40 repeat-like protein [Rhizopogon salebrosus TDB-379]